jgi:hypothetical protein
MHTTCSKKESLPLFPLLMVVAIVLVAAGQAYLLREIRSLRNRIELSANNIEAANARVATHDRERDIDRAPQSPFNRTEQNQRNSASWMQQNHTALIATLEQRVNELTRALEPPTGARAVAEYNVMSPPFGQDETEPPAEKRGWGEEQIVGPPDTPTAADARTAWAPREQNAGPEWLAVEFPQAVDVAEIRIRETFNPGAISKVTGMVDGQEHVLWEGTATGGAAPRDFVIPVQGTLQANSVVVHLDTARIPGWNEIDAVELVGKDGSRQWASSVTASSTYASGRESTGNRNLEYEGFRRLTR